MKNFKVLVLLTLFCLVLKAKCEKVLFFHILASYSHQVATWPLAEALGARGHEVTYISPFHPKEPNPNITFVVPKQLVEFIDDIIAEGFHVEARVQNMVPQLIDIEFEAMYDGCEALYTSPEFKTWLAANPKYDLVLVDNAYQQECGFGLAYKLGAKYISYSTVGATGMEYDMFGYVPESSAIPQWDAKLVEVPMHFFDRVYNALQSLRWRFWHVLYTPKLDHFIRNTLKIPQMPYIGEIVSNVSLVFYTDDVVSDYPRSVPPNYVNIACIHCRESTKPLPKEMENFLQSNITGRPDDDGFVYVSLGSLIISSNLPENIKQVFFETIKSFPNLKFLWKWNGELPKEIPKNLYLAKWFPQIDVLSHSKIQAFVTQNGRPSTLEALYNGVPMISFPCIGDQDHIASRLTQTGAGIKLEIGNVKAEEFKAAIQAQVYDPKVKARMAKYKKIFRDKPMTPLETAVWWAEYVLRTEDTSHLRPAGFHQNMFVRRQIDVWAFLSISVFVLSAALVTIFVKITKKVINRNPKLKQH